MPYVSKRQEKWAHTATGKKALGEKTVQEFDRASKGKKLPERAKKTDLLAPRDKSYLQDDYEKERRKKR